MAVGYNPRIVTDGLVLCLDAGNTKSYNTGISTTTWTDLSGRRNNGTLTNGPTFDSANGGSILFDGTNDYMSANISCSRTFYSLDWWARPTALSNFDQVIMMNSSGTAGSYWQGFTTTANSAGRISIGTNTSTGNRVIVDGVRSNGVWDNFTWTFDNGSVSLYKNSVLLTTSTIAAHSADFTLLQIGAGPTFGEGTLFDGNCAALRLYSNKVLTAQEVSQNFNALRGRFGI